MTWNTTNDQVYVWPDEWILTETIARDLNSRFHCILGNLSVSFQVYDIPPSSVKGPVFSVPVGEIKPQGVYDIPPTQGVSELEKHSMWMSTSMCGGGGEWNVS